MKRRGARVVSSSSAVVDAPTSPSPVPSPADGNHETLDVVNAVQPSLTIPTLNIFARFQSRREDFDADWLMVKEDPSTGEEKPPLSAQVADKLRRHQAQLGAHRAAAAADRSAAAARQAQATSVGGANAQHRDGAAVDAGAAAVVSRRQRRPDTYDSADDEGSVSAVVSADVLVAKPEESEEGDYEPERYGAVQDRRAKAAPKTATPSPPPVGTPAPAVAEKTQREVMAAPATPTTRTADVVEVAAAAATFVANEGLTGDYLNFHATGKALGEGALQATVQMPAKSATSTPSLRPQQQQQQQQRGAPQRRPREAERTVVVPLWSISRMERHGGYCQRSPLIALHQEITDLVDYLRPTEAEVTMRRFVEQEIGKLVDHLWPGARVMVYGSMYTHLLLPLSDLDMTLLDVPVPADEALTALAAEIKNAGLCENGAPLVILNTKVPLIKFAHTGSLIDVDISVGALDGKRNSECVMRYLNTYPEALPLVTTVKYFLLQRGMHEPYHGGLGSYAATLLVIAFLRQHPIYTTSPEERGRTGLGKLFVDFLRMCGQYWSYARVAVSLGDLELGGAGSSGGSAVAEEGDFHGRSDMDWAGGGRMQSPVSPSSPRGRPMGPAQGSIEDPLDPANNAASSLRLFHSVSSMFTYAYTALTADFEGAVPPTGETGAAVSSPSSVDISHRPTLLSRIFHVDAELVFRRQAIASTYARLSTEMPAYMADVRRFRRDEDAGMLPSGGQSWRQRRQETRGGTAPFLWESAVTPRTVTSLAERLALAHLSDSAVAATSPKPAVAAAPESGNPWKRLREDSPEEEEQRTAAGQRAAYVGSSSNSEGSSRGDDDDRNAQSDSGSNASSVRVDVSRETERRRRMRRS